MDRLDNSIYSQEDTNKNKYGSVFILISIYIYLVSLDAIAYVSTPLELFMGCNYYTVTLVNFFETLLMAELKTHLQQQFALLNTLLHKEKQYTRDLRKAFPISKVDILLKFEREDAAFAAQIINHIVHKHNDLTTLARSFNLMFGFPILMKLLINLQIVATSLYNALKFTASIKRLELHSLMLLAASFSWPVVLIAEITFVARGFDRTAEKVKFTEQCILDG